MRLRKPVKLAVLAARAGTVAAVLGAVGIAWGASDARWSTSLPEAAGVQQVAVGSGNLYVVWADKPVGHTAALSESTGRLLWRADTASEADLLASGSGVVWSAQDLGSSLVEQRAASGGVFARFHAPDARDWQAIAATGADAYGLTGGERKLVLSVYAGSRLARRVTTGVPKTADCNETVGGEDLYLLCVELRGEVLYRLSEMTGRVLALAVLPQNAESDFAYENGSIYLECDVYALSPTPRTVLRYAARSLKHVRTSRPMDITGGISSSGSSIVVQGAQGARGTIITLNPSTLAAQGSAPIPAGSDPGDLIAGTSDAFVVVNERSSEAVLSIPLAR